METKSESTVSLINESIFYQEFTFDKNNFEPNKGHTKELADNVILLDDIKIIIQIKERNKNKARQDINKWFKNKVLTKAKKQIKDTVFFFEESDDIVISNRRNQQINIEKTKSENLRKVIIYDTDEKLSKNNENRKFYNSKDVGYIHIFNLEDYYWICKYLITPAELNEYLLFREKFTVFYKEEIINELNEQYLLSHFIETDSDFTIKKEYSSTLTRLNKNIDSFDMYEIVNYFTEKINLENPKTDYSNLFKEICKLKRTELEHFKERYFKSIQAINDNQSSFYRFGVGRTNCGFVFLCLDSKSILKGWNENFLRFTELYKYRHKLQKCVGIVFYKSPNNSTNINFCYFEHDWEYDNLLENISSREKQMNGKSKVVKTKRYNI